MKEYNFSAIESKWQKYWDEHKTFEASNDFSKKKFYGLVEFPYPSGHGMHVGHIKAYSGLEVVSRKRRMQGYNVLFPIGFDAYGLPTENTAIKTGVHPRKVTDDNIKKFTGQLKRVGFSFDWSREVRTSDPKYYKWTQWIFIQLFNSWYNKDSDKAEDISTLISVFEKEGNTKVNAESDDDIESFTAEQWNAFSSEEQQKILLQYRLTFLSETEVNWCPALGTVLANDEIVNGVSERGGHPVERKKMKQWSMRISAYAQRLLDGLDKIDWPQPLKDSQTNWIGRSEGAMLKFPILDFSEGVISVFTTRPDTIFGVSFMTLAPEHELVAKITTDAQKEEVEAYIKATSKRSELDRMSDVKTITGAFTGAYAEHPFTKEPIPIWIGDYVLAGYGTGAVMSVPCGDQRDYDFAKHFNIDIPNIFEGVDISEEAFADKEKTVITNSDFLNGLPYKKAMKTIIYEIEKRGFGYKKVNYRMRDAVFSRQRYWGEPFPVYYVNGLPQMIDHKHLPIVLPEVEKYLPTEDGKPPLGNAEVWAWDIDTNKVVENEKINHTSVFPLELNTMPGWAGSSQYFNRYMDPNNENEIFSQDAINYWQDVDLYIGGSEHATGHLLYSRFWQNFMFDKGLVPKDEYAKKLINQGMILGTSAFVYEASIFQPKSMLGDSDEMKKLVDKINETRKILISKTLMETLSDLDKLDLVNNLRDRILPIINNYNVDFGDTTFKELYFVKSRIHIDLLEGTTDVLNIQEFKKSIYNQQYKNAEFILENDKYIVGREVEKMSKSKYNVVNPDAICEQYGADSLRMYEMFLGPLEQAKPWNTAGISGVHSFLKKLWKLYHSGQDGVFLVSDTEPSAEAYKVLHKTIKKVEEDIENFSFNTSVSTFMIAVNELTAEKCTSRAILEPLLILNSPYAPHIAEELWSKLGYKKSIATASFPKFDSKYLVESTKTYPISFNGKMRFTMDLSLDLSKEEIETAVMAHEKTGVYLQGRTPKKVIIVPGKIVNIVG